MFALNQSIRHILLPFLLLALLAACVPVQAPAESEAPVPDATEPAQEATPQADVTPIPREEPLVRAMAAVSLGRIGASRSLAPLRECYASAVAHDDLGRACGWAIAQMTGEAADPVVARNVRHVDWFLVPIE